MSAVHVAEPLAKSRDKRSAEIAADPEENDAESDASTVDPTSLAAREALRAPPGSKEGAVLRPGEGWGRNMTVQPTGDWHGTRDGKGCKGTPLAKADPTRGLVEGQCPECRTKFKNEESAMPATAIVDPKHEVQRNREMQRQELSRQVLAKMLKKLGVTVIRTPEHVREYDAEVRAAYKNAGL